MRVVMEMKESLSEPWTNKYDSNCWTEPFYSEPDICTMTSLMIGHPVRHWDTLRLLSFFSISPICWRTPPEHFPPRLRYSLSPGSCRCWQLLGSWLTALWTHRQEVHQSDQTVNQITELLQTRKCSHSVPMTVWTDTRSFSSCQRHGPAHSQRPEKAALPRRQPLRQTGDSEHL